MWFLFMHDSIICTWFIFIWFARDFWTWHILILINAIFYMTRLYLHVIFTLDSFIFICVSHFRMIHSLDASFLKMIHLYSCVIFYTRFIHIHVSFLHELFIQYVCVSFAHDSFKCTSFLYMIQSDACVIFACDSFIFMWFIHMIQSYPCVISAHD